MAIPVIANSAKGEDPDAFTTAGFNSSASGSLFVVFFNSGGSGGSSIVSDNKGNTYTEITSGPGNAARVFICANGIGGTGHTFTVNAPAGSYPTGGALEITGADTSSPTELLSEITDTATPFDSSVTTTAADRLLICFGATGFSNGADAIWVNSGWTKVQEEPSWANWYPMVLWSKDAATAGTYNSSITDSSTDTWSMFLATFAIKPNASIPAPPVVTQSTKGHYSGASSADTGSITTVAGRSLIAAVIAQDQTTAATVTDTYSNTWTALGSTLGVATYGGFCIAWYICRNPTMGSGHVFTAIGAYPTIFVVEISGLAASSYTEGENKVIDTSGPNFTGTVTTTGADRLVLSFLGGDGGNSAFGLSSGWTMLQEEDDASQYWTGGVAWKSAATAGTYTCDWSNPGSFSNGLIAQIALVPSSASATTLSASATISLSATAGASAKQATAASATVSLAATANVTNKMTVAAIGTTTLSSSANLSVSSSLSLVATASISLASTAGLSGKYTLASSQTVLLSSTANLTDKMALAAAGSITLSATAPLNIALPVAGTGSVTLASSANIADKMTLAGTGSVTLSSSANLTASSANSLNASATISLASSANAVMAASNAAVASITLGAIAGLSDAMTLAASGSISISSTAALRDQVAAAGSISLSATANAGMKLALAGTGSITLSAVANAGGGTPLAANASISLTSSANAKMAMALSSAVSISISATTDARLAAPLAAAGTIALSSTLANLQVTSASSLGASDIISVTSSNTAQQKSVLAANGGFSVTSNSGISMSQVLGASSSVTLTVAAGMVEADRLFGSVNILLSVTGNASDKMALAGAGSVTLGSNVDLISYLANQVLEANAAIKLSSDPVRYTSLDWPVSARMTVLVTRAQLNQRNVRARLANQP
jgi:hypothetical protein